jgi:DNA-binding NarL/FixJ family response regulator
VEILSRKEDEMEDRVKILVVDDEPEFGEALKAALRSKGYEVVVASDKVQAQEMAQGKSPDMVVLGTIMPRGDAFRLHQWLKASPKFSDLPIIVVDAPPEKQLIKGWRRDEGLRLDVEDYLVRPIPLDTLVFQIEKLLDRTIKKIKVLIVDDHAMIRDSIQALLSLQKDMQVVGEAVDGKEAVEKTLQPLPDVVLMDIVMPGMDGLEAARKIHWRWEEAKVLILTQYDDEENLLVSQQVGALGFIPKTSASSQLLAGIRSVSQGNHFILQNN